MHKLGLLAVFLFAGTVAAADKKFVNEEYNLEKVADGVYAFIAPESDSGVVQSNCTVVIGEDAALVADTGQFPSLAERMVADIKKLTNKPVRYIVNTHWHFDHVWGNGVFRNAYPGAAIISTEFTREMIEDQGPKVLATQPVENKKQVAQYRKMVADGKYPGGQTLSEGAIQSMTRLADTLEHIDAEFPHTVHTPPTIGFEKELTINLGKREVKVMWLGRANTGGDAILWLPDVRVLIAGDTVVYPAPFATGSYMSEWPVVLQKIIDMNAASIVPGHGPVMHDTTYLKALIELLQALTTQVKAAVAQGLSLEETRKKVTLVEFKERFAGYASTDLWRSGGLATFLYSAIDRAYQEATGKMKPESEE
ncbi:MAG TPA: MBL fold metallo-hydrolase [Methylomirabilota bacterium]|nr:MBL fold metallo-hydrolase [Methylomirabilota bacterium]